MLAGQVAGFAELRPAALSSLHPSLSFVVQTWQSVSCVAQPLDCVVTPSPNDSSSPPFRMGLEIEEAKKMKPIRNFHAPNNCLNKQDLTLLPSRWFGGPCAFTFRVLPEHVSHHLGGSAQAS